MKSTSTSWMSSSAPARLKDDGGPGTAALPPVPVPVLPVPLVVPASGDAAGVAVMEEDDALCGVVAAVLVGRVLKRPSRPRSSSRVSMASPDDAPLAGPAASDDCKVRREAGVVWVVLCWPPAPLASRRIRAKRCAASTPTRAAPAPLLAAPPAAAPLAAPPTPLAAETTAAVPSVVATVT
jgi:hypothetical protein